MVRKLFTAHPFQYSEIVEAFRINGEAVMVILGGSFDRRVDVNSQTKMPEYREPTFKEKIFNRVFGFLVGLGLGLPYNYLLQVRGRKSGRIYSTPVNLLEIDGKKFLVAPRGRTQWVRNVEATSEITLKKGSMRQNFRAQVIPVSERTKFLKLYLEKFTTTVQRYFPVPAGSDLEAFRGVAENYPVFELVRV
jgi:deazaflavin-dependent oxidoreductase (nitroreductase family)